MRRPAAAHCQGWVRSERHLNRSGVSPVVCGVWGRAPQPRRGNAILAGDENMRPSTKCWEIPGHTGDRQVVPCARRAPPRQRSTTPVVHSTPPSATHAEPGCRIAAQNRDAQRNRGSSLHSKRAKRGARGLALQLSGTLVCVDENVHTRNLMSKKRASLILLSFSIRLLNPRVLHGNLHLQIVLFCFGSIVGFLYGNRFEMTSKSLLSLLLIYLGNQKSTPNSYPTYQ